MEYTPGNHDKEEELLPRIYDDPQLELVKAKINDAHKKGLHTMSELELIQRLAEINELYAPFAGKQIRFSGKWCPLHINEEGNVKGYQFHDEVMSGVTTAISQGITYVTLNQSSDKTFGHRMQVHHEGRWWHAVAEVDKILIERDFKSPLYYTEAMRHAPALKDQIDECVRHDKTSMENIMHLAGLAIRVSKWNNHNPDVVSHAEGYINNVLYTDTKAPYYIDAEPPYRNIMQLPDENGELVQMEGLIFREEPMVGYLGRISLECIDAEEEGDIVRPIGLFALLSDDEKEDQYFAKIPLHQIKSISSSRTRSV